MAQEERKTLKWVGGNKLRLIIPLQKVTLTAEGKTTEDYYPAEGDKVMMNLQTACRTIHLTPTIEGSNLIVEDNGTLSPGTYDVVITVTESDGTKRRSKWRNIVCITDTNAPVMEEYDDFPDYAEGEVVEASVFYFAKGDKGDKGDTGAQGPQGEPGRDGRDGKDGSDADVTADNITQALGAEPMLVMTQEEFDEIFADWNT